jgi:hypothetical protein
MTNAAWIMLACTWTIVIGITGRLFWKVVTTPLKKDGE